MASLEKSEEERAAAGFIPGWASDMQADYDSSAAAAHSSIV
jgi:hypothetical protein